jgi:ATP-dependent Clp protease protease subunit
MLKTKSMLDEVKEAIINAYQNKTHLSRQKLAELMDEESCFSAKRAVELGFADGILYDNKANVLNLVQGLQSLPKAFQIPLQNAGVQVAHQPKVTAKNADFSYTEKQLILMKELL